MCAWQNPAFLFQCLLNADIYYATLTTVLLVVNPAYHGNHRVHQYAVVQAVLAMEVEHISVIASEEVARVYRRVFKSEQSPYPIVLLWCYRRKALLCGFLIFPLQLLGHHKLLNAILAWILEYYLSQHAML